ncbi:hypothetical protein, partial [Microbispora sp. NPDC046933]|uniref:hypothetical protein n=1 Tax=Microbispora sp. NPDC046933 TaxID=3155618 RepID=UPI003407199D
MDLFGSDPGHPRDSNNVNNANNGDQTNSGNRGNGGNSANGGTGGDGEWWDRLTAGSPLWSSEGSLAREYFPIIDPEPGQHASHTGSPAPDSEAPDGGVTDGEATSDGATRAGRA